MSEGIYNRICPNCREEVKEPEAVFEKLNVPVPAGVSKLQLWQGAGCPACKQTGYKGRVGIYELMILDDRFHDTILHRAGAPEFLRLAQERGMRRCWMTASPRPPRNHHDGGGVARHPPAPK
jgi:type IV pilus assembly protein PilB